MLEKKEKYTIENIKKELVKFTESDIKNFAKFTHKELLVKLLNIKSKLIIRQKYNYFESDTVKSKINTLPSDTIKSYNKIVELLTVADDINPFLSKKIFYGSEIDFLFVDWEIKHLHLNVNKEDGSYFSVRADYLLFMLVIENNIYFIDVVKHKNKDTFEDIEYLKTIKRNWQELIEPYKITDRKCEDIDNPTNKEIKELRQSKINVPICIDGEVYMNPNNGISAAGTNFEHEYLANQIIKEYFS